jgi:AraC family transcriptional activator of pobA
MRPTLPEPNRMVRSPLLCTKQPTVCNHWVMRADGSRVVAGCEAAGLTTDRFPDAGLWITVDFQDDGGGPANVRTPRSPHRHAYHELIWNRRGTGRHLIDGEPHVIGPGTMTIVGRGQIHVFESGRGLSGAIVRFRDESVGDQAVLDSFPTWLLDADSSPTIFVPDSEAHRLESLLRMLGEESRRPLDGLNAALQHHLLCSLLVMLLRWHQSQPRDRNSEPRDVQLYRRFLRVLDQDFARHHDTQHYAAALRVPAAALTRSLTRVSGKTTKELVIERVMLEAARLLRFSDLTVGEIAFQAGFSDPFYFSRAFKRRYDAAPLTYRAHARGGATPPPLQARGPESAVSEKSMDKAILAIPRG